MSTSSRMVHDEKELEKQMGCMSGFFQLFDRQHMYPAKRIYATKRLTPSPDVDSFSSSSSGKLAVSPASTPEQLKSSPECLKSSLLSPEIRTPAEVSMRMTRPFAVFELKEGSRSPASSKFREFPRLSLDSRAIVDGKGSLRPREIRTSAPFLSPNQCDETNDKQRRSPSVIARLMGLDALPDSGGGEEDEEEEHFQKAELRRSTSESRSRDLIQYPHQYNEGKNLQQKQHQKKKNFGTNAITSVNVEGHHNRVQVRGPTEVIEFSIRKPISEPAKATDEGFPITKSRHQQQQRKCFFDSQEFYPEPKQTTRSLYGEIEKRLKMRGIDEPEKDLETLKQILEALQLKGLLHSNNKPAVRQIGNHQRNFVFDRRFSPENSPIIVIQPSRFPSSPTRTGTNSTQSNIKSKGGNHRKLNLQRDRVGTGRNGLVTDRRIRNNPTMSPDRSPSSLIRRNPKPPLTIETQIRRGGDSKISTTAQSPKITSSSSRRIPSDHTTTTTRSPRNNNNNRNSSRRTADSSETHQKLRAPSVAEDESSSISESSIISSHSQIDVEEMQFRRSKREEEYKEGKTLLERCDELLHSIAEMNATESQQPSPVSVLDSSFYKDDSSSPSPVLKRCIGFKDRSVELEDENWGTSPAISPLRRKSSEQDEYSTHDSDFLYVSEVLQTMDCVSDDSEVFFLLETHHYKSDSSYVSRHHRKLIFDMITEILDKKRQLPPWKVVSGTDPTTRRPWLREIWSEFLRFRENRVAAEDLLQMICGLLRRDMTGDTMDGWQDSPIEMSEVVLDVERSIFKDLIGETIRDLVGKHRANVPRRKLMF